MHRYLLPLARGAPSVWPTGRGATERTFVFRRPPILQNAAPLAGIVNA
jgi:hypothetical protein